MTIDRESASNTDIELYPRGFIFSSANEVLPEIFGHFTRHTTPFGMFAHHASAEVAVRLTEDFGFFLVGHVGYVPIDQKPIFDSQDILDRIIGSNEDLNDLHEFLYNLSGRYALIIASRSSTRVYNDAHGMRTVYVDKNKRIVSSHLSMHTQLNRRSKSECLLGKLPLALAWDKTDIQDVEALIPNHYYDLESGKQVRFFLSEPNRFKSIPYGEKLRIFSSTWRSLIEGYANLHPLAMSLTGGLDSRVSYALAKSIRSELNTFTYTTSATAGTAWSKSLDKDRVIVEQILATFPSKHTLLHKRNERAYTPAELSTMDLNSAGQHGRWILDLYMKEISPISRMHLRANLLETARNYYARHYNPNAPYDGLFTLITKSLTASRTQRVIAGELDRAIDETNAAVERLDYGQIHEDYSALDAYYWEIRMGRWVAEVFNETDVAFDTFIPFNVRSLIDIAISVSDDFKNNNRFFTDLINTTEPALNFYGVNDTNNLYEQSLRPSAVSAKEAKSANFDYLDTHVNSNSNLIKYEQDKSELQVPVKYLLKGTKFLKRYVITGDTGLSLSLFNKYDNPRGRGYIRLNVNRNGTLLAHDDIANWSEPFVLNVPFLKEGDEIVIELEVLKNCASNSWATASRTEIQLDSWQARPGAKIRTDNPYLTIENSEE
ncbi:hypothetical protein [Glutamicibacter sp. X7]